MAMVLAYLAWFLRGYLAPSLDNSYHQMAVGFIGITLLEQRMEPATIAAITASLKALSDLTALIPKKDSAARQQLELLEQQMRLLKNQAESLSKEVDSLRRQTSELERENRELQEKLAHHELSTDYKRIDGMDWKQNAEGEWKDGPYCPNDHALMSDTARILFKCRVCGYSTSRMPR